MELQAGRNDVFWDQDLMWDEERVWYDGVAPEDASVDLLLFPSGL